MVSNKYLLILCCLALTACPFSKEHSETEEEAKKVEVLDMGSEIKLPASIWEKLATDQYGETKESGGHAQGKDVQTASIASGSVTFLPVKVILKEKSPGVLTEEKIEIEFPRGGGEVDLTKFVKDKQGTFIVNFEFPGEESLQTMKVFYVSKARKRRIDDQIWGAGCKQYMDIKDFYLKKIKKNQFFVNTTKNRHLSVLGGHFIFASSVSKQLQVAQVTFKDSKQPQYFCNDEDFKRGEETKKDEE